MVLAGCGKFKKAAPAEKLSTPQQCIEQSVFDSTAFRNDCIGLKFFSALPFLYGDQKTAGQTAAFAVPGGDYSVKIMIFEAPYKGMTDEVSQQHFMDAMKSHILQNEGVQVTKEDFLEINKVPVVFLETQFGKHIDRNYYFYNRGRWTQLTLTSAQGSSSGAKQDALIKNVTLY